MKIIFAHPTGNSSDTEQQVRTVLLVLASYYCRANTVRSADNLRIRAKLVYSIQRTTATTELVAALLGHTQLMFAQTQVGDFRVCHGDDVGRFREQIVAILTEQTRVTLACNKEYAVVVIEPQYREFIAEACLHSGINTKFNLGLLTILPEPSPGSVLVLDTEHPEQGITIEAPDLTQTLDALVDDFTPPQWGGVSTGKPIR